MNCVYEGDTALHRACKSDQLEAVKILLEAGADVSLTETYFYFPLVAACETGNVEMISLLVTAGADVKCRITWNMTCLHVIASVSDSSVAERKSEYGKTKKECVESMSSLVRLFLQQGVNINAVSDGGSTALYLACYMQHLELVQVLLEAGADVTLTSDRCYPLIAACRTRNVKIINLLLKAGADVKCVTRDNETCLHAIASSSGRITASSKSAGEEEETNNAEFVSSVVRLLLQQGIDVNAVSDNGDTALYCACESGQLKIVEILLKAGADVNLTGNDLYPLIAACNTGNVKIISLLVKAGADVGCKDLYGNTCLPAVALSSCQVAANWKTGDEEGKAKYVERVSSVVRLLLCQGVDVNANSGGYTSLYYACSTQQLEVAQILLEAGMDANLFCYRSHPLLVACRGGNIELINMLINAGADVKCIESLLDEVDHKSILNLIRAGAKIYLRVTIPWKLRVKSIRLCQLGVLAGYRDSAEELHSLREQLSAAGQNKNLLDKLLRELLNWLSEDSQQVPSLLRQCHIAIRRQLSATAHFKTILPAVEQLEIPDVLKQYLLFDGPLTETEVDQQE